MIGSQEGFETILEPIPDGFGKPYRKIARISVFLSFPSSIRYSISPRGLFVQ